MPIHIEAKESDLAKVVLLPGDPLRAKYIAENYLQNFRMYNENRLLYGYTGLYKDTEVSIQATGMGTPSLSIIVEELHMLGVKYFIRIGTCGSLLGNLKLGDLILVSGAHSSHDINSFFFNGACFSGIPDFFLTSLIYEKSKSLNYNIFVGPILTSETFYEESFDLYKKFSKYGTLAVEMESYALFTICAKHGTKSATILTVSDLVYKGIRAEKDIIKKGVDSMIKIILETINSNNIGKD
ncbi:MAG: DeoD-type purine-nucleoside phosphorylase [Spirochaetes bacterium]|nr:DeoD-type purine-nucleoside phosphorylase [Spirochaetota bacterium]